MHAADYSVCMEKLPEKKSETVTIRLTHRDKTDLLRIARADKRPPAQLAAIIIEEWLEARRGK